jgi:D-lyxose ketol-isomerase
MNLTAATERARKRESERDDARGEKKLATRHEQVLPLKEGEKKKRDGWHRGEKRILVRVVD